MPAIQLMTASGTKTTPVAETSGARNTKTQGLQNAFSNYMRQNSSNTAQTAKDQAAIPQAKAANSGSSVKQQYEQYQNKSAAKADQVSGSGEGSEADTDTVTQAVDEAVADIKESIKENLGVDDEQLEAAMQLLGLTQADLLDPQQLVALAVELTGSEDAGMMLFQENFQIVMQETSVITKDLLQELGMSMDDLMTQIHTALEQTEQPIETMLPEQEQTPEILQEAPQQTEQAAQQEVQQTTQTAETKAAPQQTEQAAQTVQAQPRETAEEQPDTVQVQEAQPHETKQAAKTGQEQGQQQNPQAGEQETLLDEAQPQNTLNQKQQPQEQTRFDFHAQVHPQETTGNVQAPQNLTAEAPLPQVHLQEVIDQIVEYTKVHLSEDVKSIEMQLNPANLGKVYLHVSEKQGVVTAQLSAQNENLKEALVQQAAVLKDNLNQQGIKVDAVEVSVGAHEFESNLERDAHSQEEQARQQEEQNRRHSRRTINVDDLNNLDGISGLMSEEEALVAQIMRDHGNNVDYKA